MCYENIKNPSVVNKIECKKEGKRSVLLKAALKKCVLSRCSQLEVFLSSAGSAFHKASTATPNDQSPRAALVFHGCNGNSVPLDEHKL